jgi:hypothetical protein
MAHAAVCFPPLARCARFTLTSPGQRKARQALTVSQIVVEERLSVSDVAIHELPTLWRDLRELRAEAGR